MITDEERQSIINEAVEKALLTLPEVIGNIITNQMTLVRTNREFYEKHPEFASRKDVVASVVEKLDGEHIGATYAEILNKAVPLIRDRMKTVEKLEPEFKTLRRPSRDLSKLDLSTGDHGEL